MWYSSFTKTSLSRASVSVSLRGTTEHVTFLRLILLILYFVIVKLASLLDEQLKFGSKKINRFLSPLGR